MKKIGYLPTITLLYMLLILCNSGKIIAWQDDSTQDSDTKTESSLDDSETKVEKKKNSVAKKSDSINNSKKDTTLKNLCRSEKKLFINGQDSPISIVVTDKNNKQHYYTIPAGRNKQVEHVPLHIKKIVCNGNYDYKDIPISGTALNTYSVFIFTIDNKLEQIHFIDIKQKERALNYAKNGLREAQLSFERDKKLIDKLTKKVEEIQDQTIYLQ